MLPLASLACNKPLKCFFKCFSHLVSMKESELIKELGNWPFAFIVEHWSLT